MANCGGCAARAAARREATWKWVSADGKSKVTNLTEVQAKTRANLKGGTASKQ